MSQRPRSISGDKLEYLRGFGGDFESEAIPGALPRRNNPARPPMGLYSELITTTSFMAPRQHARRAFVFRLRPSVVQGRSRPMPDGNPLLLTAPLSSPPIPAAMRWTALAIPEQEQDFVDGLRTICANGNASLHAGAAIHVYLATRSMRDRCFACNDGELLIIPQEGSLRVTTEFGILDVAPREFLLVPKGIKFRVELRDGAARGFVCENYGVPFQLPELGPIGSTGLANPTDFRMPVASFEDRQGPVEYIQKYCGRLWASELSHSPFDVVAWRGSTAPVTFDMADFTPMGSTSHDHADPSILCALTSPHEPVLGANVDFLLLTPQWIVGDDTFRAASFHRNAACEFSAMVLGNNPVKGRGGPGDMILHNAHVPHGPDLATVERASSPSGPARHEGVFRIAFETGLPMSVTEFALRAPEYQDDYVNAWAGIESRFTVPDGRR